MATLEAKAINEIVHEHNMILIEKLHKVYKTLGNEVQHQLKNLQQYIPNTLEVTIESIVDERDNKQATYWSNVFIKDKNNDDVYFDSENDNLWKQSLMKHFNIKDEDTKDVKAILSAIETQFEFTKAVDAHSTDGTIEITKNRIFIKLGIEGEQPIEVNDNIHKLKF